MKVKTNAGEVELTAEMVRPGMVFRDDAERLFTVGEPAQLGVWKDARDPNMRAALGCWREDAFLGCDPEYAARADCERYGIAPGIDAGAHGFARTRDGGAVDLRRALPFGAVTVGRAGWRLTAAKPGQMPLLPSERFLGLHARHACAEDVARLCCLDVAPADVEQVNEEGRVWIPRCTLAIGDHDEHEDIASGVRWKGPTAPPLPRMPAGALDRVAVERGVERLPGESNAALRARAEAAIRGEMRRVAEKPAGPYRTPPMEVDDGRDE